MTKISIPLTDDAGRVLPMQKIERAVLMAAIEACNNNKARAAKMLGLSKATLFRRLKEYATP